MDNKERRWIQSIESEKNHSTFTHIPHNCRLSRYPPSRTPPSGQARARGTMKRSVPRARANSSRVHPTSSEDPKTDPCLITEPVAGNLAFHEYLEWLGTQLFYTKYGFDGRAGMGVVGGSLIGVSTALAHVYDKSGRVVGETMPREAEALVKFFDETCKQCAPHTQNTVWDAPYCAEITKCQGGPTPDHKGEQAFPNAGDAKTGALLPEKELLHAQVSDALAAMVRALQKSDGYHGGGAFFCTDYFGYPGVSKARNHLGIVDKLEDTVHPDATCTPGTLKKLDELFKFEPAFMMLRKVTQDLKELALVVPYPKEMRLEDVPTLNAWRQLYPSRILVLIPISSGFSSTTSCTLLAAITHAQGKEEIARRWADESSRGPTAFGLKAGRHCSEIPRPCILAVASGGYGTLTQMRAVSTAEHSVQLICLEGSGRVADMWAEAWPRRGQERFELRTARIRLQRAACKPPQVEHIDCMRQVLSEGELTLHPMSNESSALQRLCENLLTGDKIVRLANSQYAAYKAAQRHYSWPRLVMTNTSIILGFLSTLVAVLLPDSNSTATDTQSPDQNATAGPDQSIEIGGTFYQVLYFASIILPALMLVVDQVEGDSHSVCPTRSAPLGLPPHLPWTDLCARCLPAQLGWARSERRRRASARRASSCRTCIATRCARKGSPTTFSCRGTQIWISRRLARRSSRSGSTTSRPSLPSPRRR